MVYVCFVRGCGQQPFEVFSECLWQKARNQSRRSVGGVWCAPVSQRLPLEYYASKLAKKLAVACVVM